MIYREHAQKAADAFRVDALMRFDLVLEGQMKSLVDFICEMQQRVDLAEGMVCEMANTRVVHIDVEKGEVAPAVSDDLMQRIRALAAAVRERKDGNETES